MPLGQYFETIQALGGDVTIVLVTDDEKIATAAFTKLWRKVYEFEKRFSRFLPASELSQFNRRAGLVVPISREFTALLAASQRMSKATNGLYNPFILPALQRAGYTHSALPGYEQDSYEDYTARQVVAIDELLLKDDTACMPYGTAIDMGGCGKGYLADLLADELDALQLAGYWVSLSGDMVTCGTDEHGNPWRTTIQSAKPNQEVADCTIVGAGQRLAIATSGTFQRPNQALAKQSHHIIDPRTRKPATTDVLLATIVTDSALEADVLASCAVIVGSRQAPTFLRNHGVQAAYLQMAKRAAQFGALLQHGERIMAGDAHEN